MIILILRIIKKKHTWYWSLMSSLALCTIRNVASRTSWNVNASPLVSKWRCCCCWFAAEFEPRDDDQGDEERRISRTHQAGARSSVYTRLSSCVSGSMTSKRSRVRTSDEPCWIVRCPETCANVGAWSFDGRHLIWKGVSGNVSLRLSLVTLN